MFRSFFKSRLTWFLIGLSVLPALWGVRLLFFPDEKAAMGVVGFYEEHQAIYTFLGDHEYKLSFPGNRGKFEAYAKRMGLSEYKISDNEYSQNDTDGQWSRSVIFKLEDDLANIQYQSSSQ